MNREIGKLYTLEQHLANSCENNEFSILAHSWGINKVLFETVLQGVSVRFPTFSAHDISHSVAIISCIEHLLGEERIRCLKPTETWMLLNAALLHDWGMVLDANEIKQVMEGESFHDYLVNCKSSQDENISSAAHNLLEVEESKANRKVVDKAFDLQNDIVLLISDFFRSEHGVRSEKLIVHNIDRKMNLNYGLIQNRLLKMLGAIVVCHTKDFGSVLQLPYQQSGFRNDVFHPRFIAAMLRLGDLLDMDNLRFNRSINHAQFESLPPTALMHQLKHLSLKELLINEREIRVMMDCPDAHIYRIARTWLQWLDDDLKALSVHWGQIVPKDFVGQLPFLSEQRILINGKDAGNLQMEFSKNQIHLLLEGQNLYTSELAWLQELLQNALDASKIQVYRDLEMGVFPDVTKGKQIVDLTPFDLINSNVFISYPVTISIEHLETDEQKERYLFRITIQDNGTGIDEDAIGHIKNVCVSYRSRQSWKTEIEQMPFWLRPTGGFGIGLQSVFQKTKQITMVTKTGFSAPVQKIELIPLQYGGYINVTELDDGTHWRGTKVSVDCPVSFDAISRYFDVEDDVDPFAEKDFAIPITAMANYIESQFANSFFPMYINTKEVGVDPFKTSQSCFVYPQYHYDDTQHTIVFWDQMNCMLITIEPDGYDRISGTLFKGTPVGRVRSSIVGNLPFHVTVDIYGKDVTECLTINREQLTKEYSEWFRGTCLPDITKKCLFTVLKVVEESNYGFPINYVDLYFHLLKCKIPYTLDTDSLPVQPTYSIIFKLGDRCVYGEVPQKQIVRYLEERKQQTLYVLRTDGFYDGPEEKLVLPELLPQFDSFPLSENDFIFTLGKSYILFKHADVVAVNEFKEPRAHISTLRLSDNTCRKFVSEGICDQMLHRILWDMDRGYIRPCVKAVREYEKLAIMSNEFNLPYSIFDNDEGYFDEMVYAKMYSPVNKAMMEKAYRMSESEFVAAAIEKESFARLLTYTYENQNEKDQYSLEDIKEEYIRLIVELYNIVKETTPY